MNTPSISPLVEQLATALKARGQMMATAESCTGGLIAGACTEISGSSDWFERGFVTYSNAAKSELLGVPAALIEAHGAVSEAVARAMAAIANGQFTPQARLVSQVQDLDNKVIEAFPPSQRNDLNISQKNIKAVHKGMSAVVNDGGGTGRSKFFGTGRYGSPEKARRAAERIAWSITNRVRR